MSLNVTGVSPMKSIIDGLVDSDTNCRVGRTYKKSTKVCKEGVLCSPADEFEMLEKCTICNKIL